MRKRSRLLLPLLVLVAATASAETFRGQLVCSVCWDEADRTKVPYGGKADLDCAAKCAKEGIPPALAIGEPGKVRLVTLDTSEAGGGIRRDWLPDVSHRVEIDGRIVGEGKDARLVATAVRRIASKPGRKLPARELEGWTMDGTPVKLSDLRGRPVLLNFWATWCAPCRQEMLELEKARKKHGDRVAFVGFSTNGRKDSDEVKRFLDKVGIGWTSWLGANAGDMEALGLPWAVPGTVVLDEEGAIVEVFSGPVTASKVSRMLEAVLPKS